jgi:putative transposase
MVRISPDSPAYYLTSVPRDRLPVFRTDQIKEVACEAIDEARRSGGFLMLAYVIMPDHIHLITAGELKVSQMLRYINWISAHRMISHLKEHGHASSLRKLERKGGQRQHKYSLWDHNPDVRVLTNEESLMQRVNYSHQNPVRLELVDRAEDYRWSSARQWRGLPSEDEPLLVDLGSIQWRRR